MEAVGVGGVIEQRHLRSTPCRENERSKALCLWPILSEYVL